MKDSKYLSRKLRRFQTKAEKKLWYLIRNKALEDTRFTRQHPLHVIVDQKKRFFIADFYCPEQKLVIEIDGKIHEKQKEYDAYRTDCLCLIGLQVVRFTNEEAIENPELVLHSLRNTLRSLSRQKRGKESVRMKGRVLP